MSKKKTRERQTRAEAAKANRRAAWAGARASSTGFRMSYFNRVVAKKFGKARLTLRKDAFTEMNEYLSRAAPDEFLGVLDKIVARIKETGGSGIVRVEAMRSAIEAVSVAGSTSTSSTGQIIFVIDAVRTPRFRYDVVRKAFAPVAACAGQLHHGAAKSKREMFAERFRMIHQRLLRQKQFAPPESRFEKKRSYVELTLCRSLLSQAGERRVVFGMISCHKEGSYVIEDLDCHVELDLREAKIDTGLFTENCFVLAEGVLEDDVFVVSGMSFPPAETRKQTLLMYPNLGSGGLRLGPADRARLEGLQKSGGLEDQMAVILSDVWLDKPAVLDNLRILFKGFSGGYAPLFVLMGNFTSRPLGLRGEDLAKLRGYFGRLAKLILEFPDLVESAKFVFVPGPRDIGIGNVLPRPGLPAVITRDFESRSFPKNSVIFPSNPCRVLYGTRELLFFRQDITHQMRRNCIVPPATHETKDVTNHLVKTLLEQSHLCPLPLTTRPVHWNTEHALRLYPLPDLLVLGDRVEHFNWSHYGCSCVNPACFALDQSFVVYHPASGKVDFSRVDRAALDQMDESD